MATSSIRPRLLNSNEILHYGVHHKWFPKASELLAERQPAGKLTTAVWFLEADARTEASSEELLAAVNGPRCAEAPVRWLGFFQVRNGGHYQKSYGDRCKVQVQGSQCIVFTRGSLQAMYDASSKTGYYSHWDLLVWRSFETGSVYVPKEPLVGTCGHYSHIKGKGALQVSGLGLSFGLGVSGLGRREEGIRFRVYVSFRVGV